MKRAVFVLLLGCNTTSTTPPTPPAPSVSAAPTPSAAPSATASATASATPSSSACTKDDDCAAFSSYCGDLPCACVAYVKAAGAPKCNQPNTVKCLVDPCQRKAAACQDGKCVVTASGSATQ